MKIQNKKSHKKIIVSAVVILIVAALAGGAFYWINTQKSSDKTSLNNNNSSSSSNNDKSSSDKSDNGASTTPTTSIEPDKNIPAGTGTNSSNSNATNANGLTVSAVAFRNGDQISIQNVMVTNAILSGGTATFINGNYEQSTTLNPAHNGPSYTQFDNFSVPANVVSGKDFTILVKSSDGQTGKFTGEIQ